MERGRNGGNWETSMGDTIATEQQGCGLCCQETAESTTNTALITKGPVRFPSVNIFIFGVLLSAGL